MSRTQSSIAFALSILLLWALTGGASQQRGESPRVQYVVTLDRPQTQMVGISMSIADVDSEHIDFMLPVWRPGRYVMMSLAQSIRDFRAFGDGDRPLAVEKTDKATWRVALDGSKSVRIEYGVYCNSLGDRTRHVDDTHAFLSGACVFMYTEESRAAPCRVRISKPADWKIACGLDFVPGSADTLHAANYDVLIDSPLEIGEQQVIEFEAAGKPHSIAIWGEADVKADELKRDFTKIIEAETKIFGSAPYERYVFLVHAGAGASGGTEHINSTIMQTSRASLEETSAIQRFMSLVAHEFFHTWNIKAFRPNGLIPYEYQRENYTDLLWVAEGTTSYYAALILVRAGFTTPTRYLESLSDSIDSMRNKPGETVQSVSQASFDSWIHYGSRTPDDVNSTVDFYGKGSLVSLLIDLEMRKRSGGKAGLDDVMRALYERYPLSGGKGYTTDDLQAIVEELAGTDFDDVFDRSVRDAEPLDFERAFEAVGVELYFRPGSEAAAATTGRGRGAGRGGTAEREPAGDTDAGANPDAGPDAAAQTQPAAPKMKAYLGLNLSDGGAIANPVGSSTSAATQAPAPANKTTVTSILRDSPAYASGILVGDEIIAIDGKRITAATLDARLRTLKPDQTITITYFRRDQLRTVQVTLAGKPDGRWTLRKTRNPSDEQKAAYEAWIGQKF